jgi:hypothetical protein
MTKHDELHGEVLSAMVLHLLHQHPELARLFTENPDEPLDVNRVLSVLQTHNQRQAEALKNGQFAARPAPAQPARSPRPRNNGQMPQIGPDASHAVAALFRARG